MRKPAALIVAASLLIGAAASDDEILIFGGANNDVFLGCLNCAESDAKSVWNGYSRYGWANSYGIWSEYGQYGGEYGTYSACNPYTSTPPILVDRKGNSYGYLSVNEYKSGSVCSVMGAERVCRALKVMCAHQD